jgi:lipoprotein-anchoring transpeptidase ErfK/SrfK
MISVWSMLAFVPMLSAQTPAPEQAGDKVLKSVTFASQPGVVWVPLREMGDVVGWQVTWDEAQNQVSLDNRIISENSIYRNPQKRSFIKLSSLPYLDVQISHIGEGTWEAVKAEKKAVIKEGEKRVEINLNDQVLVAWQGPHLVMTTNVSTGRKGFTTPTGNFKAIAKTRHRVSRKYNNSPMPFSVQLFAGYFIHGASSVPRRPASHGCVRMPLGQRNAAKEFFDWVTVGTPVAITREWSDEAAKMVSPESEA